MKKRGISSLTILFRSCKIFAILLLFLAFTGCEGQSNEENSNVALRILEESNNGKTNEIKNPGNFESEIGLYKGLTPKLELKILQSWIDNRYPNPPKPDISNFWICGYYGTYNDAVAVMIDGKGYAYMDAIFRIPVGNIIFVYNNSNFIHIWKDGRFYNKPDALSMGLLSLDDVKSISEKRGNTEPGLSWD